MTTAMDILLAKGLYKWACKDPSNRNKLEEWLDLAVESIASGQGSSVMSTTANGVSVTFSTKGMSNAEWMNTLVKAIEFLDTPPTSKITGVIR